MNKVKMMCIIGLVSASVLYAEAPAWFIPLRDAVLEQVLSSSEVLPLYETAKAQAESIVSKNERNVMLARCENIMGQVYQREGQKTEAGAYYGRGETFAKSAIEEQPTSEAYYVLAESIACLCDVKGFGYQVANGMRFINNANKAISLDPNNVEAKYLLVASNAFANPPFRNLSKAKKLLDEILENEETLPNDVRFNVYYALGIVHQKEKKPNDARAWFELALSLYPTNKDAQKSLKEI
ncbi:MAG: tetratricopeptide repeat protein [Treponema sp.]|nr:tetratricopeptide repeat protein [Treponema sp.]